MDTHLITSHYALPLLLRSPGGLVVEVTDGTASYNATRYRVSTFYDLAKTSVVRLAWALGEELRDRGATAVAITPGWLRSEAMLEHHGVTEANWRESPVPHFCISESPRFVGRAIAALAADPDVARWNGRSSPPASSRRSTASRTWTAPSPTAGATSSRSRRRAFRPTTAATADGRRASA